MPHTAILTRIRGEYLEMPGLRLTLEQAQRLFGVEREVCKQVLDVLVDANVLCVRADGVYARPADRRVPRPQPAKADLGVAKRIAAAS